MIESGELVEIALRTVGIAAVSTLVAALIGIPLGIRLGYTGRVSHIVSIVIYTGMSLPSVIVGLLVYLLLSRSGPLGVLGLLYTPTAMVIAQIVLALPLIVSLTMTGVASKSETVRLLVQSLGLNQRYGSSALIWECRKAIVAAVVAGFGGSISEVGAAALTGGDIRFHTRVLTTSVVLETRQGNLETALLVGCVLLGLALIVTALVVVIGEK
jgi:tungstate transport system permease protein